MGHSHHLQNHQHEAMDGLVNLFTKANHDLNVVQHRLEKEFQQIYPENVTKLDKPFWFASTFLLWVFINLFSFIGKSDEAHFTDQEDTGWCIIAKGTVRWATCCQTGTYLLLYICIILFCTYTYGGKLENGFLICVFFC